jgi:hypothetical protein
LDPQVVGILTICPEIRRFHAVSDLIVTLSNDMEEISVDYINLWRCNYEQQINKT